MQSSESLEMRKAIKKVNPEIPLAELRTQWEKHASETSLPDGIFIKSKTIEEINTDWLSYNETQENIYILYFHGGGYTTGSCITHRELCGRISQITGIEVIIPDYPLAPENPFPIAIQKCMDIYKWLLKNIAPEMIFFGGDSSGGGLAAACLLKAKELSLPLPNGAFMFSPWFDMCLKGKSYSQNTDLDPLVNIDSLKKDVSLYLQNSDPDQPLASPLLGDLKGLPPLLIHVGSDEVMLSDSADFTEKARQSDVPVDFRIWEGMWHVFQAWPIPESQHALKDVDLFIRKIKKPH